MTFATLASRSVYNSKNLGWLHTLAGWSGKLHACTIP